MWWIEFRFSWLDKKNKKVTINDINDVALNDAEIGKKLQGKQKIKPFINKYNCKEISYPSGKDVMKKF